MILPTLSISSRFRHVTFSSAISVLGETAETIWRQVAPGKYGDCKIVASFYYNYPRELKFSFKKKPFYLGISNAEGTKG